MNTPDFFENTSICLIDNHVLASRMQLEELYGSAKTSLRRTINKLKSEGKIVGAKIGPKSGKTYEVYNLKEVIAIGLRLNTDKAFKFHTWAVDQLEKIILQQAKDLKQAQLMESYAWNQLDARDNYRRKY